MGEFGGFEIFLPRFLPKKISEQPGRVAFRDNSRHELTNSYPRYWRPFYDGEDPSEAFTHTSGSSETARSE